MAVVDANDQSVGVLVDPIFGNVLRKVGSDWVWFNAPMTGIAETDIAFYHLDAHCNDARVFLASSTAGLAYGGLMHSGVLFYTKAVDPQNLNGTATILALETFHAGEPVTSNITRCVTLDMPATNQSVGAVEGVADPAFSGLVAPYHIK
jgi:hypothetical protein